MRVRELNKQQATFEQTIKSANEKKLKADEDLEAATGQLNESDVAVENAKGDIESLNRSRNQLRQKLTQIEAEISSLENKYNEAIQK
jgi:chromosome segregation ATPase